MRRILWFLVVLIAGARPALAQNCYTQDGVQTCSAPTNISDSTIRVASTPTVNTTQTWNNGAVTFTNWKSNVTNTNSASASLLIDQQVGGTSKFKVDLSGNVTSLGALTSTAFNITGGGGVKASTGPSTCLSGPDNGCYLNVLAGQVFINSATLAFGTSGTADTVFTRAAANELTWPAVLFASLGTPANGTMAFCSDCTIAATCAGSGTGALAKRLNGAWVCN